MSENWCTDPAGVDALRTLLIAAKNLKSINISELSIEHEKDQIKILEAFNRSPSQLTLEQIHWNEDIKLDRVGRQILDSFLTSMPNLKTMSLA